LVIVSKDHAFTAFIHLAKVLENENNCHISSIKSDHVDEFENERFEIFATNMTSNTIFPLQEPHSRMELWRGIIILWKNLLELC